MTLHPIDLAIVVSLIGTVLGLAWYTRRFTRSVADFLSANRCAGRYLLTIADGMAGLGAVSIVASWEQFYQGGFAALHWGGLMAPLGLVLAMSGFVIYRFRQTRALTLAQFLEMRYSRRFRVFAGLLCFLSGVLNYGIFPAVSGRFLIYFLDLPIYSTSLTLGGLLPGGGVELNWTLGVVMAINLGLALLITLNGGQIAVMVSDFLQGQLATLCFLVLLGVLLWLIPWSTMTRTLQTAAAGESKLNPFDQGQLPDFSPWFFVMLAVLNVYGYRAWQGSQAYSASATSPHEAKMAGVLAQFRSLITLLLIPFAAIAAWVLLHGEVFPAEAAAAQATIDRLTDAGQEQLAQQLTTTVALKQLLPVGVLGLLATVMIMAAVSTDSTYLHSWGSILIQDVVSPIRERRGRPRLSPEAHLRWLKRSVLGIAVFAWCFSMLFPVQEFILMYFQATGAIFLGGAGAVLIGGLYWKHGTTAAAWTAMSVGSVLAVTGVLTINLVWPTLVPWLQQAYPDRRSIATLPEVFWLNGMQWSFGVAVVCLLLYVVVSLATSRDGVDFDRLYHRGRFAVTPPEGVPDRRAGSPARVPGWQRKLGITEEFTVGDKVIYALKYALFGWTFGVGFVGLTVAWALGGMRSDAAWIRWWGLHFSITAALGVAATVWFLWGGFKDLFAMFRRLRRLVRDQDDDGHVTHHLGQPAED